MARIIAFPTRLVHRSYGLQEVTKMIDLIAKIEIARSNYMELYIKFFKL